MKRIQLIFLLIALLTSSLFALSDKELAHAIDLAGKQRMLTQKMSKEALLIRSKIDTEENIKKLKQSSSLFDKTLKGLMNGDSSLHLVVVNDPKIKEQLQRVQKLWDPFYQHIKEIIDAKADDKSYSYIESHNLELLKEMNKAVSLYSSQDKSNGSFKLANDINLAGKQRMLTQKMAKDLLFINNNFKKEEYLKDFQNSKELFTKTLDGLFNGSSELNLKGTKLPMITKKLQVVKKLWQEEQPLLDSAQKGEKLKEAIAALDNTLVKMNEAVQSYTKSLNRQKQVLALNSIISGFLNNQAQNKKRVNLSGKQRMLTQRMSKLALLSALNIDRENNTKALIADAKLYNKTLNAFLKGDKDLGIEPCTQKSIKEQVALLQSKWQPFLEAIIKIVKNQDSDGKALNYIIEHNEDLLKESNELVNRCVAASPTKNFLEKAMLNVINIAGRQRMLTQKMTKEKLLIETKKLPYQKKLQETVALFDSSLQKLIKGDAENKIVKPTEKKVKEQLDKIAALWTKLKPLYLKEHLSKEDLQTIIKENPTLLFEMNKMVDMAEHSLEY